MIKNTTQKWEIGQVVRVGFVSNLKVLDIKALDGIPDTYSLEGKDGAIYEFTPHYGLNKITEGNGKMAGKWQTAKERRQAAINRMKGGAA